MAAQPTIETERLHPYGTDAVVSRDGTTISCRVFGSGPGVVILHGTMSSAYNHEHLAEALADAFNDAYRAYFPNDGPPRTTVQAAVPREGFLVEIRIIAGMPG